jgi:hypothetical protein
MNRKLLAIYLNDHLAGATAGVELARRSESANRGSDFGSFLHELGVEIESDRRELADLMGRLGIAQDRLKVAAAWTAEKVGRLKPNGALTGYSPLSRVLELEALSGGVEAKLSLWRALGELSADARLGDFDSERFIERARSQLEGLERHHRHAARLALKNGR